MDYKLYLLTDENVKFCLKQLKSFKTSRWLSPLLLLPVNYFFILGMFHINSYSRFLLVFLILSVSITVFFYFVTSTAIKRYGNIIIEIKIAENGNIEFNTLMKKAISIKNGDYKTTNDLLTINRYNLKVYVIIVGEDTFSLVPEWFNDQKGLDYFLE